MSVIEELSPAEIPQQHLAGESIDPPLEFALARACLAHCVDVGQTYINPTPSRSVEELVGFVSAYGASSDSELYRSGHGWEITKLADLLRLEGYQAVSQNMNYTGNEVNVSAAAESGRVRSDFEKSRLVLFGQFGGATRDKWLAPVEQTLLFGGYSITSIQIPLLSGDGYGPHAVLVLDIDKESDEVTYFDPDFYNTVRHVSNTQAIEEVTDAKGLIYKRPLHEHLAAMTGEVLHIFPKQ